MAVSRVRSNAGGTLAGLLGIAFVVLRLCKVTDWSWWWVTAPFWGGAAFAAAMIAVFLAVGAVARRKGWRW